ncbi:MAG: energy-coupling factor transporter ATPase [Sedimentibacter sp.]|uniref:ABC transporter ATP-binding protein n=1 Tax=Sedimentibacter sp. TaxID=1960295 RepID=UPI0031594DAF
MELFKITNLSFTYPNRESPALEKINLTVKQGEFVTLCGKSGCGKSTLLRHMKTCLAPFGIKSGEVFFRGRILEESDERTQTSKIGYVMQNPDNQIVTDKVWHELAFGLESLGFDNRTIRLRVAEMASFFGIQTWFMKDVSQLSGGQKQLLNLASIMAMQPDVLILDEPTSQLDPIAANDFLETVKKINRDIGTTVIMSEHRLEEVFSISDRVVVMDRGAVIADGPPRQAGSKIVSENHHMSMAMPSALRIAAEVSHHVGAVTEDLPLTAREGREWMDTLFEKREVKYDLSLKRDELNSDEETAVEICDAWFRYDRDGEDIIKDLSMKVRKGQFYAIVGGNGTGKTTALSLIWGLNRPYRGKILIDGKDIRKLGVRELFRNNLGVLPQNPQSLFSEMTLERDLYEVLDSSIDAEEKKAKVKNTADLLELGGLMHSHPYDLSGGEQQKAALAKILLLKPGILLLDEPTKALDSHFKNKLAQILKKLQKDGTTIVMVSHDIEFCAEYADLCSLFFNGTIVATDTPEKFFSGNSFYTTAANRISRNIFKNTVTAGEVIELCRKNCS